MIVKEKLNKYEVIVDRNVREEEKKYQAEKVYDEHHMHDRLFKSLIHRFFEEFMEGFFSKIHKNIDFSSTIFLSEEMFTDAFRGVKRQADIVVEVKMKAQNSSIIVHVEPQSSYDKKFPKRMFEYYTLLYNKFRKSVLPVALYSYDSKREGQNTYEITVSDLKVISFQFLKVQLSTMNWRKYLKSNNPVLAALLSKMDYTESEKVEVKKSFFEMLARMKLSNEKNEFLIKFFEHYLQLSDEEEEELMAELKYSDDWEEIMKLPISYEEKGREKGREEGIEKNREEIAVKLLDEGMSVSFISKITALTEERITELRLNLERKSD